MSQGTVIYTFGKDLIVTCVCFVGMSGMKVQLTHTGFTMTMGGMNRVQPVNGLMFVHVYIISRIKKTIMQPI